jgi:hypothetical protein
MTWKRQSRCSCFFSDSKALLTNSVIFPHLKACHVNRLAAEFRFVVMALAVQMHQVEFIDQSLALEPTRF